MSYTWFSKKQLDQMEREKREAEAEIARLRREIDHKQKTMSSQAEQWTRSMAEAERRGMEKAASIAEPFVSYGDPVDASVGLGPIGKRIAAAIRAKAQEVT